MWANKEFWIVKIQEIQLDLIWNYIFQISLKYSMLTMYQDKN